MLCLFHTFTVNQFSPEDRAHLERLINAYGMQHDLFCISIAAINTSYPQLTFLAFENGVKTERVLANCSGHGHWLAWLE